MADIKRNLYNCALGSQGFILTGTPERPARTMVQAPVFGNRYALGDRDYTDFTFWWYWAQTEWANGFKDSVSWANDGKFYYSTNIDTWSEYGAIKLASGLILEKEFTENITCGSYEMVAGTSYGYIGTDDDVDGKPRVYRSDDWTTNIVSAWMPTSASWVNDVIHHKEKIYILTTGSSSATTYVVTKCDADGTNQVDYTGTSTTYIYQAMGWQPTGATSATSDDNTLYIAVTAFQGAKFGIVKTDDNGANWTKVLEYSYEGNIPCMLLIGSALYYLIEPSNESRLEFRKYDISASADAFIYSFPTSGVSSVAAGFKGASRRLLHYFNGKLIISIPRKEIWQYDGTNLTRLKKLDDAKDSIGNCEANFDIGGTAVQLKGGIIHDNKLWWANLMYDGTYFSNTKKPFSDDTNWLRPVFSDGTNIYWTSVSGGAYKKLYKDSNYKGATANANFLIFNQIDIVSTIDKLFYTCNLIFKPLVSGQKIIVEYTTDPIENVSTWHSLGSVDFSVDGGTITDKTLYFPENTIEKKLWLRVELEGGGSNTPILQDISIAYYPVPEYKQRWSLTVNCIDNLTLLDGKTKETKRGEELRNILKTYWKNKNVVEFQDVDFAETLLDGSLTASATTITVDSTNKFPEQGIIRIEKEKIKYTGKTATAFTGCTRGYEGTVATTHSDNTVCSNSYKVIITNYAESTPVGTEAKINEFLVNLELMEI